MKCLLVSDLHYALKQYDWVLNVANEFDVVIIGGDHLDIAGHVEGRVQITVILKYLEQLAAKTKLVVCSGNHDLDSRNEAGEKTAGWIEQARRLNIPADGDSLQIGEALFTICPWWDGPVSQKGVTALFEQDAMKNANPWIWVYHAPPLNSPTGRTRTRDFGDQELNDWIASYSPDIVLTGHIHEAPFETAGSWVDRIGTTWVFNAGRQIGAVPAHIIFDTERQKAAWFSLVGTEEVDLASTDALPRQVTALPDWLKAS